MYIPLVNRVHGQFCKLWTKFFPRLMAQVRRAWAIKRETKGGPIPYGTDQANEVNKMFII